MTTEPIQVTLLITNILENLQIPYFIGGSMATAVHGVARSTLDVDLVIDMKLDQIAGFMDALGKEFYADEEMIRDSLEHGISFNLVHNDSMFKVDMIPAHNRAFDHSQFDRREKVVLSDEADKSAYFASPEDNILAKLEWYRLGGETSDRQWNDILNVLKIRKGNIDVAYLRKWATELGIEDILEKALASR